MDSLSKTLLIAGGVAGAGALLYCLLRDEPEGAGAAAPAERPGGSQGFTKEQVLQILNEISGTQEKMKASMKVLTKELMSKPTTFDEAYKQVQGMQPDDVLERYGLRMEDFDQLLMKHQSDPQVREGIVKIMGGGAESAAASATVGSIKAQQVVDAHALMLEELEKVISFVKSSSSRGSYDPKAVAMTAQAIVAAKVEEKFGWSADDMEASLMAHQETLAMNQDFCAISMKMQRAMSQLVGEGRM